MGACSSSRISKMEKLLGVTLPTSFREFVLLKGGGGLEAFFILGVTSKGDLSDGGTVSCVSNRLREEWVASPLPSHLVPVQLDEDYLQPFCLDTSRMKRGECPVVVYALGGGETEDVAPNFVTFFEKYTAPYFKMGR